MRTMALIPARAGSERCPGKNKAALDGKPLICWTIEAAQLSAMFDDIVVSTDDPDVGIIAMQRGCKVIERPFELAQSDSEMLPVVKHAYNGFHSDVVMLLQPTSPFRTAEDICNAFSIHESRHGDAVISVTEAPKNDVFEIGHAGRLHPTRHTVVVPNGAIYLITGEHLLNKGDWYSGISYAYQMPKERSLDIDTKMDLEYARMLVKERAQNEDRLRYASEAG